jgi:hypothetical protein
MISRRRWQHQRAKKPEQILPTSRMYIPLSGYPTWLARTSYEQLHNDELKSPSWQELVLGRRDLADVAQLPQLLVICTSSVHCHYVTRGASFLTTYPYSQIQRDGAVTLACKRCQYVRPSSSHVLIIFFTSHMHTLSSQPQLAAHPSAPNMHQSTPVTNSVCRPILPISLGPCPPSVQTRHVIS